MHAHKVDDNQSFEDCYVPIVEEMQGAEDEGTWAEQFFEEHAEQLWLQYEESFEYHQGEGSNVGDRSAGMDEVVVEDVTEVVIVEFILSLVVDYWFCCVRNGCQGQ